jgi:hypothetical protein
LREHRLCAEGLLYAVLPWQNTVVLVVLLYWLFHGMLQIALCVRCLGQIKVFPLRLLMPLLQMPPLLLMPLLLMVKLLPLLLLSLLPLLGATPMMNCALCGESTGMPTVHGGILSEWLSLKRGVSNTTGRVRLVVADYGNLIPAGDLKLESLCKNLLALEAVAASGTVLRQAV